jgi:broad specificity phosphatase PhoE
MTNKYHIVRHAESVHNVTKDFSLPDPELTPLGHQQSQSLGEKFPFHESIALIISSPLRRAIQTTLDGFSHVLDARYFESGSGKGVSQGIELVLDPDLQERSALLCDTGSVHEILKVQFPKLDFSTINEEWRNKKGFYADDDEAVKERAKVARMKLKERAAEFGKKGSERTDIVVVTHGVFMKFLTEDKEIDLAKAAWRSYSLVEDMNGNVGFVQS